MSGMLASVTSADEARLALLAGVDIVDFKNPAAGALGALPLVVVRAGVAVAAGRLTSATVGDLPAEPALIAQAVAAMAATGVTYVKVGLLPGPQQAACIEALQPLTAAGVRVIVVLFADQSPDWGLLAQIAAAGCAGVMLDTADKRRGRLGEHLTTAELAEFVAAARAQGLLAGLAGSLQLADIPVLLPLGADYLGFRGALCGGTRTDALNPTALAGVRAALAPALRKVV